MAENQHLKAKLFADGKSCRQFAADRELGTYEFGTELTEGGGVAALKNVTYGASGQQTSAARMGKNSR